MNYQLLSILLWPTAMKDTPYVIYIFLNINFSISLILVLLLSNELHTSVL